MAELVKEYGKALYEIAEEENRVAEYLGQIRNISVILRDNPDFIKVLSTPNIKKDEKSEIIDRVFSDGVDGYIVSFFKLMTDRNHARKIPDCLNEFERLWYEKSGIVIAEVVTAVPLSPEQRNRLYGKLEKMTGKEIEMRCTVDPAVIGGVSVIVGGKQIEGTVRARLDGLHSVLSKKTL